MSIRRRLDALEKRAAAPAAACPRCRADWVGSVVLAVHPGGQVESRCVVCGHERPYPVGWVKAYAAGLFAPGGGGPAV